MARVTLEAERIIAIDLLQLLRITMDGPKQTCVRFYRIATYNLGWRLLVSQEVFSGEWRLGRTRQQPADRNQKQRCRIGQENQKRVAQRYLIHNNATQIRATIPRELTKRQCVLWFNHYLHRW